MKYLFLVGILFLGIGIAFFYNSDYHSRQWHEVEVVGKLQLAGKYSGTPYMALKLVKDNTVFDLPVSVATYVQYNKGDRFNMYLRGMDIQQTWWDNFLFIIFTVKISIGIVLTVGSLLQFVFVKLDIV